MLELMKWIGKQANMKNTGEEAHLEDHRHLGLIYHNCYLEISLEILI